MARVWTALLVLLAVGCLVALAFLFLVSDVAPAPPGGGGPVLAPAVSAAGVSEPEVAAQPPAEPAPADPAAATPGAPAELPAPAVSDLPLDELADDGPLPYRKERLLLPAELDERIALLEAQAAQEADDAPGLTRKIAELREIRALNVAVNGAWSAARDGELQRGLALLASCASGSSDADVQSFLAEQERALLDRYGDGFRR